MFTNRRSSRDLSFGEMWNALEGFYGIAKICYNWALGSFVQPESTPDQLHHGSLSTAKVHDALNKSSAQQHSTAPKQSPQSKVALKPEEDIQQYQETGKKYRKMKKQQKELLNKHRFLVTLDSGSLYKLHTVAEGKEKVVRFAEKAEIIPSTIKRKR